VQGGPLARVTISSSSSAEPQVVGRQDSRSPGPQSGWPTDLKPPRQAPGAFSFSTAADLVPVHPCAMIRPDGTGFLLHLHHRRSPGSGLHALESDLPGLWTYRRCPVAAADRAERHHPGHLAREHSPTVPTMWECHPDDRCPSTQHCLRAEKAKTLAA
jgi:hypothetical protein